MKIKIYISEKLLEQLVENYEVNKDGNEYNYYDSHKRLEDDDMCNRYYTLRSEENIESFCLLGELDEFTNLIVDEDLIDEE